MKIIERDDNKIQLEGREYFLDSENLEKGEVPLEMEVMADLAQILQLNLEEMPLEIYLLCLESIWRPYHDMGIDKKYLNFLKSIR